MDDPREISTRIGAVFIIGYIMDRIRSASAIQALQTIALAAERWSDRVSQAIVNIEVAVIQRNGQAHG